MTTDAVTEIAELRAQELDPGRIVRHIRQVEADFAEAIEERLRRDHPPKPGTDERDCGSPSPRAASPRRCSGRWRCGCSAEDRSLPELAPAVPDGAEVAANGPRRPAPADGFVIIDKTLRAGVSLS